MCVQAHSTRLDAVLVHEREFSASGIGPREARDAFLSIRARDLPFRMFYVLVDIFRFSVVSFHLPRNLYIDPKVFYYTTENQFSLQCVLV
jgi:hypothetical protein